MNTKINIVPWFCYIQWICCHFCLSCCKLKAIWKYIFPMCRAKQRLYVVGHEEVNLWIFTEYVCLLTATAQRGKDRNFISHDPLQSQHFVSLLSPSLQPPVLGVSMLWEVHCRWCPGTRSRCGERVVNILSIPPLCLVLWMCKASLHQVKPSSTQNH